MNLAHCTTEAELLRAAADADQGLKDYELNFPAAIIMLIDTAAAHGERLLPQINRQAELAMLHLALLNCGHNVPSPFVMAAHAAGWRYRGGFQHTAPMAGPAQGSLF